MFLAVLLPFLQLLTPSQAFCSHRTSFDSGLAKRAEGAKFGYHGANGPQLWHTLAPENQACKSGNTQSPIPLSEGATGVTLFEGSTIVLDIADAPEGTMELENLGTTLEIFGINATMSLDLGEGRTAEGVLAQIHFHTPSEHLVDGEFWAMEMHAVFQSPTTQGLTVIGVPIDLVAFKCNSNSFLESVFTNLHEVTAPSSKTHIPQLPFKLLQTHISGSPILTYSGSLTTPPCSEGVRFLVTKNRMNLSVATWKRIKNIIKFNARPVQNDLGAGNYLVLANN